MSVQYKRVVDFSKHIIDAEIGYDGLIVSAKCTSTTLPTQSKKFQEGCTLSVVDKVAGTASLYFNSGTSIAPVWSVIAGGSVDTHEHGSITYTATAGQTSFTLPNAADGTVEFHRNGVRLNDTAYSVSGTTVTYIPSGNDGKVMEAGDNVVMDYQFK